MLLMLMVAELVKAIERPVSLPVTTANRAGILRRRMLFHMAGEVKRARNSRGAAGKTALKGGCFGIGIPFVE
jgi:hypothetical protein